MKKSLVDLIKILEVEIKDKKDFINSMSEDKNPQVKEMILIKKGELSALEGVLHYAKTGSKNLI